ncbi:sugar ABC transporter substrate-binding protein [Paenibacillus sp. FSL H8-0548]|uniref:ABC transporter substrate-binding protein n=1 Tax=Paenibacillus sp. FSL H8-0548 TaxID=1920422 RepID=UPI0021172BA4|nr:sugar ABC transporter substrate-binding protein [Paenibacillus sp. FSL H8-0548]
MRDKRGIIVLLIVCAMLLLGGCQAANSTAPDIGPSHEQADNGREQVILTYASWGTLNEKEAKERMITQFMEKYPWITIQHIHEPGEYIKKLTTMYASNKAPDVFMLYKHTALQWAEQGKLYNLKKFLEVDAEINEDSLISNAVMYWERDKVAGIKVAEEAFALYYNADLFQEAGVALPPAKAENAWSWEQFLLAAKKLTLDRNGHNALSPDFDVNQITQFGVRFNSWMWYLMVPSNDASVISPDGSKMNLDDPAVIDAVQKLADLIYVHHVAPSPIQSKNLPQPALALQSRKIAMDLNGQWVQIDLGAANVNYGVGVLPKLKTSKTIQFGEPLVMSSTTRHPEEAWLFYKWQLDAENSIDLHRGGLWMPLLKDYYTKPELIARWADLNPGHPAGYQDAVMRQTIQNGVNSYDYYLKNNENINAVLQPALDQVWLGKKNVKEAFESVADKMKIAFRGTYP